MYVHQDSYYLCSLILFRMMKQITYHAMKTRLTSVQKVLSIAKSLECFHNQHIWQSACSMIYHRNSCYFYVFYTLHTIQCKSFDPKMHVTSGIYIQDNRYFQIIKLQIFDCLSAQNIDTVYAQKYLNEMLKTYHVYCRQPHA